jgi:hypothetical protein
MNEATTTAGTESNRQLRSQRGVEAIVAQYIHERSGRRSHAGPGSLKAGADPARVTAAAEGPAQ